ncbi:acyltransferase family protein [Pseudomonas huanghezhanensis]|uniref:acyltransferase family protein n=1 Tax=Pseudomonas huanghezhanensis TaxID=3002903 RepID=UPI002285F3C8|nr:acyltransferase family protein [Pseudomonas sp. BSw22131]
MGNVHNPALKYRPEVDGLRAVAVIPVILFHSGLHVFSGGFVGVDVFFVISGYLITSIILSEMMAGRFSLVTFYERRARRILPSLFVMMLICLPAAWLILDPPDFKYFAKSLVAVPVFSSNLLFWLESGYFDASAELKPLLHTWTLAVEEQYYVLFPLLLMLTWRLGRVWILALLAAGAVASLTMAQVGAAQGSSTSFYLLHARAWELLVGSFIAFYFSWRPRVEDARGPLNQWAALLGIGMIAYAVFAFDSNTPFPGLNALVPTLGAALIILFATPKTWVGAVLSSRGFVFIGLISYSAYLWHQPVFAFARQSTFKEPSAAVMLPLAGLSLLLAYLSWRYVEQAFRQKTTFSRKRIFTLGALGSVLFMAFGMAGYLSNGFNQRFNIDRALDSEFAETEVRSRCEHNADGKGRGIGFCLFGMANPHGTPDLAVFGDSHSEALLPAFDAAARGRAETIVHIGLGGCPPLLGLDVANGNYDPGVCTQLADREFEYVKSHGIQRVVLVARWTLYTDGDYGQSELSKYFLVSEQSRIKSREASRRVFTQALDRTIEAYRSIGTQLYVVAQVPQQTINPKNLYYRLARLADDPESQKLQLVNDVSVPLAKHGALQRYSRELFERHDERGRIKLVKLDDLFCKGQTCLIGDVSSFYQDFNHLNAHGASLIVGTLDARIFQ